MLTVRESMGLHPIDRGKVVAGFDGLDNVIESATVLEIPDAVEFLESNLLALTSLYAITDDEDKQLEVIKLLIEHGISALMIFNIGRENGLLKLPQSVIDACDESNLPLIVMPLDVSYYSVLVAVIDKLMNGQAKKLQNIIEIYETYTDQLFDNAKDYAALVNTLSRLLKKHILFFNHNNRFIYSTKTGTMSPFSKTIIDCIAEIIPMEMDNVNEYHYREIDSMMSLIVPVQRHYSYYGSLVITDVEKPISDIARLAINQTCKALAVSVLSHERMDEYEDKMKEEFIKNLLNGAIVDGTRQAYLHAKKFNMDLANINRLVRLDIDIDNPSKLKEVKTMLVARIDKVFSDYIIYKYIRRSYIIVLLSPIDRDALTLLLRKFSSDGYNNQKTIRVSISNARTEDVSVHDLFLEVTVASLIYERLSFENEYVFYDDVRVFEAVLQKISKSDIEDIIRSYLSVVKRYDILNNTDLENTLKSLINNRMSTTATANELFIHNNTVLQRKNKIASLFEQDPFSSDCYKTLETIFMLKDLFEIKL